MFFGRKNRQNCWPEKCENVLLCDEVSDHLCDVRVCAFLLKCDVMSMNLQKREDLRTENLITALNTCQIAINDLQLGSVMGGNHHISTAE